MNSIKTNRSHKKSHWISVKEALPEPCEQCLAYTYDGSFLVTEYDGRLWLAVTHWQPLPEPPGMCECAEVAGV